MLNVDACRSQFPALNQEIDGVQPVFFDGPGGSQPSQKVLDAITGYLSRSSANLGGAYFSSRQTEETMRQARESAKSLYHAKSPNEIVFGANATSLSFMISRALSKTWQQGDEIIVTALDHYSNVSPWLTETEKAGVIVHQVRVNEIDCTLDIEHLSSLVNSKTRLFACTYASNTTGSIVDVYHAIKLIKSKSNALTYIDAVHLAPHGVIDVQALDCDFLVSSAYKYFGPHLGVLFAKEEHLRKLCPEKVAPAKDTNPNRWENGTQSYEAMAGLTASIDYIASLAEGAGSSQRENLEIAFQNIAKYEHELSRLFLNKINVYPQITLYGIKDKGRLNERTPTFAFTIKGVNPRAASEFFGAHHVCIWDGHFYAQGLIDQLGLSESGGVIRVGCMHYNTVDEVEQFFVLLDKFLEKCRSSAVC
jgi:cysteine desulfurase family protein (TIGR01976 family)